MLVGNGATDDWIRIAATQYRGHPIRKVDFLNREGLATLRGDGCPRASDGDGRSGCAVGRLPRLGQPLIANGDSV